MLHKRWHGSVYSRMTSIKKLTTVISRRAKDGQFIQSTNCTDKKLVGLAQTGKEAVQYYIATRWGVKMSHARKYITQ